MKKRRRGWKGWVYSHACLVKVSMPSGYIHTAWESHFGLAEACRKCHAMEVRGEDITRGRSRVSVWVYLAFLALIMGAWYLGVRP